MIHAGLTGQSAEKAGGVKTGAGAEHAALGQAQPQRQLTGDDIAGVGDVDEHAVKAAGLDPFRVAPDGGDGEIHLGHPVVGVPQQLDLAHAVDDHVALAQIGEVTGPDGDAVGQIRRRVTEILYLAGQLLLVLIHKYQLVGDALHRQRVSNMGAHMAQTDDTENTFFHGKTILST